MKTFMVYYVSGSSAHKQPVKNMRLKFKTDGLLLKNGWIKDRIEWEKVLSATTEHQITAGGMSGSGALVGGLLLGPVGAIAGGMKGKKTLSLLRIDYNKKDGVIGHLLFETKQAEIIKDKIEGELKERFGQESRLPVVPETPSKSVDIDSEQLEKLAALKQKGVITEAEFAAKKKQLLGL